MMRVLALLVVLPGCLLKPERHPNGSSDAHPSTDGTSSSDGIPMMIDADPRLPNLMFVTSGTFALAGAVGIGAYQKAELFCNNAAMNATNPIVAHYVPWISYGGLNAADGLRMQNARAWVRMDGAPIADTVDDLCDGTLLNAPMRDENNSPVGTSVQVMTGTKQDGTGDATTNADCTIGPTSFMEVGQATHMDSLWTDNGHLTCGTMNLRLYCFGYDRDGRLP